MTPGTGRLTGKSAVVTGAGSGIGRATAELFAREGARLVVTDIQPESLTRLQSELVAAGAEVEAVVGDVSLEADVKQMVQAAVDRYGRLDVMVANAGIIPLGDVFEMSVADWDQVMAVDGRGMFLSCKYAIEAMLRTDGGSIVCLSSISGEAGQKRQSAYGPAKFVASGLTKHLAIEWADRASASTPSPPARSARSASSNSRTSPEAPSTSRPSRRCIRWAASANQPKSPRRSSSWRPTTHPSSPARFSRSMAAISRSSRRKWLVGSR